MAARHLLTRSVLRLRGAAAALLLLGLLGTTVGSPVAARERPSPDPLEILGRAFRESNAKHLRPLLQGEEKVHIASRSLGQQPGYYSGDQVYFMLEDLFQARDTVRFQFLRGASAPENCARLTATARWLYRTSRSREVSVQIAFILIRRDGVWCLKEVRDLP